MINNKLIKSGLVTFVLIAASLNVLAFDASQQGLDIFKEVKQRDSGWSDSTAEMIMVLRNKQGQESIREITIKSLEQANDGDKGLTVFNKPRDVKGTAFLSFSHAVGADDQWLFFALFKNE